MKVLFASFIVTNIILLPVLAALPKINKCKISDSECIKTESQAALPDFSAGIPEWNIEPMDVMHVDKIQIDLAGLKMDVRDVKVKGLKNTLIDKLSFDMKKKKMTFSFHADLDIKGKYVASGMLLVLPITGNGTLIMTVKNLQLDWTIPFEVTKNKDGKDVIELKSYKYKYEVKENAHWELTNLFNGNKALADTLLKFMNDNWKLICDEFGRAVLEKPQAKIFAAMKKYLSSQPLEDIMDV